jgi:hypothetical protein
MVSRHSDHWTTYPPRNFIVLLVAWVVTALLLGVVATKFQKLCSWLAVSLGTVLGSFLVLGLMLLMLESQAPRATLPTFKSTDEMMVYFAKETTKWVKADQGIDLDYSLESVRFIEIQLAKLSGEIDKTNPPAGTFGTASGYGAYIGEVFRQREGGAWARDHEIAGERSFPLTLRSNSVIFPVGWCWKRIMNGEEDNVYLKARAFAEMGGSLTNFADVLGTNSVSN